MNRIQPVLSVADVTRAIREMLESSFPRLFVRGEISNLSRPQSGHIYFSLVDDCEGRRDSRLSSAQLPCVIWRSTAARIRFRLENGLKVIALGHVAVYEPRGCYQLIVEEVEPAGVGELQRLFEELKARLLNEGLFDPARKRLLPFLPARIGLITSPSGAAIRDVLRVLFRRYPLAWVRIVPVRVQGAGAADEIVRALRILGGMGGQVDVVILARGGGSLEDLWAFNDEALARAIAASAIPTVSAIGHEVDFTISDFVADVRAQTPTHAAEVVVPDLADLRESLRALERRLVLSTAGILRTRQGELSRILSSRPFRHPQAGIQDLFEKCDDLAKDLRLHLYNGLKRWEDALNALSGRLEALNPMKVLARGYSLTRDLAGRVVTDASALTRGEPLEVRLARGSTRVRVEDVKGE